LPEGLEKLEYAVFSHNKLIGVKFPQDLRSIGAYAFHDNLLTVVNIPPGVEEIGT